MATDSDKFLTVRLPADEYQRVRLAAADDDRKLGPMARVLIRDALDARGVPAVAEIAKRGVVEAPKRVIRDAPQA